MIHLRKHEMYHAQRFLVRNQTWQDTQVLLPVASYWYSFVLPDAKLVNISKTPKRKTEKYFADYQIFVNFALHYIKYTTQK